MYFLRSFYEYDCSQDCVKSEVQGPVSRSNDFALENKGESYGEF